MGLQQFCKGWKLNAYNSDVEAYDNALNGRTTISSSAEYAKLNKMYNDLEIQSTALEQLEKELGMCWWEALGIVADIEVYWWEMRSLYLLDVVGEIVCGRVSKMFFSLSSHIGKYKRTSFSCYWNSIHNENTSHVVFCTWLLRTWLLHNQELQSRVPCYFLHNEIVQCLRNQELQSRFIIFCTTKLCSLAKHLLITAL